MDTTSPRKTTRLRDLIQGPQLSFLMEAHNGLSARIAEEAGFPRRLGQRTLDLRHTWRARQ